jgi:squalene-hopene/tetraprenyl-beta-curcumene cyclase
MRISVVLIIFCALCATCSAADWNPTLAAKYLDQRQRAWSVWAPADTPDGACFSCHTGMTYLLARPALRRLLNEKQPTKWETSIKRKMTADAGNEPQGDSLRVVETIFEALFLRDDAQTHDAQTIDEPRASALEQMWSLQYRDGKLKGGWDWYNANLEPWESPSSSYFEGTMAALAVGSTPREYQSKPEIRERTRALKQFLLNGVAERPLHSRLELLWSSTALSDLVTPSLRKSIIDEVEQKQSADGSWTLASLGPWPKHPDGANVQLPSAYATAFTAYVLLQAGIPPGETHLKKALEWLRTHQNRETGAWSASSINKHYPPGSMQELFLQDAATGFAAAVLAESELK